MVAYPKQVSEVRETQLTANLKAFLRVFSLEWRYYEPHQEIAEALDYAIQCLG